MIFTELFETKDACPVCGQTPCNCTGIKETRVGNRMSDIEIGSPKIVYYKGKAVGEVGLDHEASPGNGPFYMKHYLTGKDMVGYDTKKEALADLKHLVMQMDKGVAEAPGAETLAHNQSTVASNEKAFDLEEGWKDKLAAAGLAGAMAMGAGGAHARVSGDYVDNPEINRLTGQPKVTQQDVPAKPTSTGFSKEYLEKVLNGTHPRPMITKEKAQELLNAMQKDTNEGKQQKGADYRDPPEADYGDDYQDMVARVKKLAGLGPLKTVYDPNKRVYKNVPTAVQPGNKK